MCGRLCLVCGMASGRTGERANGRKALLVTATCASCDCDCVSISVDVFDEFSVGGIAQW